MKLWDKGYKTEQAIEDFTVGNDRELDVFLAKYDIIGSAAHAKMLNSIGIVTDAELASLQPEFTRLLALIEKGEFVIPNDFEDVHSYVEYLLTQAAGEAGKKIHTARSRNDQVLVDMKLFMRHELLEVKDLVAKLFNTLISLSEQYKDVLIPGYTHLQVAMPSSFGLWFGAYAETLIDDLLVLLAAYRVADQNPLGSAAGYGSSFPINRTMTTEEMGFGTMHFNVVAAQMSRGKGELTAAFALSSIAWTVSKLAMDACVYNSQNFGFVSFPDAFTTGSSIMPHKKNPDVFELIRAKCNRIKSLPNELQLVTTNLPSGYHRDMQVLKDAFIPAIVEIKKCLVLADLMLHNIIINRDAIKDERYKFLYTVETVNKLVQNGTSFRDAYKIVGKDVVEGTYIPDTDVNHTHEGSIGNLCNEQIKAKCDKVLAEF